MNPFDSARFRASPWIASPFAGLGAAPAVPVEVLSATMFNEDGFGKYGWDAEIGNLSPRHIPCIGCPQEFFTPPGIEVTAIIHFNATNNGWVELFDNTAEDNTGDWFYYQVPGAVSDTITVTWGAYAGGPVPYTWNPTNERYENSPDAALTAYLATVADQNISISIVA